MRVALLGDRRAEAILQDRELQLSGARRSVAAPLALALAGLLGAACAGLAPGEPVGVSEKARVGALAPDASRPAPIDGAAVLPSGYRTSFTKVNEARFVSRGHAPGRWDVDVFANDVAAKALAERSRDVPAGAIVVQEHYERAPGDEQGRAGPIMMMEKAAASGAKDGAWRWTVIGSKGQLVREGALEACAGCHDDAPADGLFPILD